MANRLALSPLYVILDAALLPSDPIEFVMRLMGAGARLFQYRNKTAPARELLQAAQALNVTVRQEGGTFLVNDRPDIARLAGAAGVHVGQEDLPPQAARRIVGTERLVGFSTHTIGQLDAAVREPVDYIAIGPVFGSASKAPGYDAVGLAMVAQAAARAHARGLQVVAIG